MCSRGAVYRPGGRYFREGPDRSDQDRFGNYAEPADEGVFTGCDGEYIKRGNLTEYFRAKSDQYALENRQTQKQFLDTLALIAESYVTVMVAGVLFLIILQAIMSVMGGDNKPMFLYLVIYLMIPFGSIMFVIMVDILTPES